MEAQETPDSQCSAEQEEDPIEVILQSHEVLVQGTVVT